MIRDKILKLLKDHNDEIRKFQIESLFLFGSVARGEESEESDIDMLVKFEGSPSFDRYMELKFFLEDLFERKVDLVTVSGLRPEMKSYVERDIIRAA